MKKLQLEDLARKLGYSKTLISMVVNGKGNYYGVSKKTQALVMEAVERLDYRPNKFAKSLRTGRSHFVGLIVSDISNPFYATIAKSIETLLFAKGYNLMVCSTEEQEDRERQMVDVMLEQQAVDGLIVASAMQNAAYYDHEKFRALPLVFIDRIVPLYKANVIVSDNYGGSVELVQHLVRKGHRRIACLAITPLYLSSIEDRLNGYKAALAEAGLEPAEELVKSVRFENIERDVTLALQEYSKMKEPPDSFYCLNNNLALALLLALKHKKYRKLQEAQVTCFDDLPLFDLLDRKVTTVAQPVEEIGRSATELLMEMVSGRHKDSHQIVLPTRLVTR